jgi:hypothetical protein
LIKLLPEAFAFIFILIAILLTIHQQLVSDDRLFNIRQMWHHETLVAVFFFGAVCLIIGKYLGKFKG